MSHNPHEQLPTPRSSGPKSGASRGAPKRWAAAAALLILALGQVAQAADGQLDPSFGADGRVIFDVDSLTRQDHLVGVAILPDGRIAVGGHTRARSSDPEQPDLDFVIGAFSSVNGALDTGFGTGGLTATDISGLQPAGDEARALALQNDRGEIKIVLVGRSGPNESLRFAAVRYRANGAPDTGFGVDVDADGIVDGIVETPVPGGPESDARDVAVQPDGKIILAGVVGTELRSNNRSGDIALVRYNRDGSLDNGVPGEDSTPGDRFGSDGTVKTSFGGNQHEVASAVAVQSDGKIVAGGEVDPLDPSIPGDFALVRYNRDGSLDDGGPLDSNPGDRFGADGRVTTGFGPGRADSVADLVVQPDGKIVAGGMSSVSDARVFALARYNVDGTIDQTFGTGGTKTTDFPFGDGGSMAALVRQPGGKLVAAGRTTTGGRGNPGDFALVRYQPNGREDTTFGDDVIPDIGAPAPVLDGIKLTHFGPALVNTAARGEDVALQSDGKIVVAGFFRTDPENPMLNDFALARYGSSVVPESLTCQGQPVTVIGTPGDDILVGTPGDDVIHGLEGNDTIIAQGGDDIVCGGPGEDLVFGGPGGDSIEGGDSIDQLVGDDLFAGVEGPDTLRGGEGDDELYGFGGNDLLEGDGGNDELVGGPGDDVLNGGPGVDGVFGEDGADALAGDAGNDTLVGDELSAGTGPDALRGGEGDDKLFGAGGDDQLFGDAGRDELDGGPGNDQLDGDPGDDARLFGGSGNDTIRGGAGKDRLVGDAGRDVLRGGSGDDRLFGGPGRDRLSGGAGNDQLNGQGGSDSGIGGSGRRDQCFSISPRGACENMDEGRPPKPPRAIPRPGSSPLPPPCNFPQCGA